MNIFVKNANSLESRIRDLLTVTSADWGEGGINVTLKKCGEGIHIVSNGENVTLYYSEPYTLFRGIAVIISRGNTSYDIKQKLCCKNLGCMVDCSRNGVLNMDSVKRFIKISALFGFNTVQLYTEDTYEIEGEPYFGHLRGRYSLDELREIDEYAQSFGIEAVPCIQTLAHLDAVFEWDRYKKLRDVDNILNVALDESYELIEKMLISSKKAFKSKRINIGMDEAHMLGRGAYLDKLGYKERSEIMKEHLARVMELCRKHGYEPMMWSDMFFRVCSKTNDYYDKDAVITQDVIDSVPDEINLIFWNYHFRSDEDYTDMLDKHVKFGKKMSFAGGVWTWLGFAPAQKYAVDVSRFATNALKRYDLDTVLVTIWGDNGSEASPFSALPPMASYAQGAWTGDTSDEAIEALMNAVSASYKDFLEMDLLLYKQFWAIVCKYMLYGDPLQGRWDYHIPDDADTYFADAEKVFIGCAERNPKWAYIFDALASLSRVLSSKARLGIRLKEAYDKKDRGELDGLANKVIPQLIADIKDFIKVHRKRWRTDYKSFGFDIQDVRLGGLIQRLEAAREAVNEYINGEIDIIEELEEERLPQSGGEDMNLVNPNPATARGTLANAYIWDEIYSVSRK